MKLGNKSVATSASQLSRLTVVLGDQLKSVKNEVLKKEERNERLLRDSQAVVDRNKKNIEECASLLDMLKEKLFGAEKEDLVLRVEGSSVRVKSDGGDLGDLVRNVMVLLSDLGLAKGFDVLDLALSIASRMEAEKKGKVIKFVMKDLVLFGDKAEDYEIVVRKAV